MNWRNMCRLFGKGRRPQTDRGRGQADTDGIRRVPDSEETNHGNAHSALEIRENRQRQHILHAHIGAGGIGSPS